MDKIETSNYMDFFKENTNNENLIKLNDNENNDHDDCTDNNKQMKAKTKSKIINLITNDDDINDDDDAEIEIIEEIVDPISYCNNDNKNESENNLDDDNDSENVIITSAKEQYKLNYVCQMLELERLGMTVTSGSVVIKKDHTNLIGISIGGGAPLCPCLYIVQVFDNSLVARDGTLQCGDELLAVNGNSVKGKTKVEVAKLIQASNENVTIYYNKLHADPSQGESLDIVLKKIKHRFVDTMPSSTADILGLSRAILCNDSLMKRLKELQSTEHMYKGLVENAKRMLKAYFDLLQTFQEFGNVFAAISVREPQPRASEAFRLFGELHRQMEKDGVKMLKTVKPVLSDLGTYLNKAIPDTKMTIRRYADSKFTYLSYCLKVKEMDDEEHSYISLQEPLYRVETGNYEYRLILRCRQEARVKFAKLRNDVLEKMELLESKHARDLTMQLKRFIEGLSTLCTDTVTHLKELPNLFPVEVDLKESAFQYKTNEIYSNSDDADSLEADNITSLINMPESARNTLLPCAADDDVEEAFEIPTPTSLSSTNKNDNDSKNSDNLLLPGFEEIDLNSTATATNQSLSNDKNELLAELGLQDIILTNNLNSDLFNTNDEQNDNSSNTKDNTDDKIIKSVMMSSTIETNNSVDNDLLK